jgi:ribosomal protein S18 acetylase RimI-like enzyme
MTTHVRQATHRDVELLVALNRVVQELHTSARPDYFKQIDTREVAAWFSAMLRKDTVRAWIAESSGSPVGYALTVRYDRLENTFCSARHFCEIDQIGVAPACRKRGVARALVERVLQDARARGIPEVELTSWSFNTDAQAAFRALGFAPNVVRFGRSAL